MDFVHSWGSFGWGELPWGSSLYERSVDESTIAADAVSATSTLSSSIQETVVTNDAVKAATVFNSATEESAVSADTMAAAATFVTSLLESASAQETVAAKFLPSCLISETTVIQDEILGGADFLIHISESVEALEILTCGGSTYNIRIAEDITAEDQESTNTIFNSDVTATATASDSTSRRLLWEPIDTGVDEDWTLINTNS